MVLAITMSMRMTVQLTCSHTVYTF